jgi:hypothetical protein
LSRFFEAMTAAESRPAPPPRRGRPRVDESPGDRARHIAAARDRFALRIARHRDCVEDVAALYDVSVPTVKRWTHLALGYQGDEADGVRRLASAAGFRSGRSA